MQSTSRPDNVSPQSLRKIIHVDMDAFFASVEQRDNPELRGKPVAVGGSSKRGVVAAASYEARQFGVKSAMPSSRALRLCPDLIFVRSRFDAYREVSRQIREIFARHTDLIQPLSLDEAYLDVTHDKQGIGSAIKIARAIRAAIAEETGLTASAGVSYNKFIAKIASDQNKPDGMCVILPEQGPDFVASLPVRRFHGVGPRTAEKMAKLGIETGADLRAKDQIWLIRHFGSWGEYLYQAARGIDDRPVNPDRTRKSIGGERTYFDDKQSETELRSALDEIIATVWDRIENCEAAGRTVTLKLRYADFQTLTRSQSAGHMIRDRAEFAAIGHQLLGTILPAKMGIRLLGLTLSNLAGADGQEENDNGQAHFIFDDIEN
ncbi:DNA polymerase IV [Sphingorhabdus arenilitoris]|uniref:DNA polymerase IV n=1 Tax=Sphingorhabdus arenilitoris TaxID=1490041 RepID=A0ABV8RC83_9SPHN